MTHCKCSDSPQNRSLLTSPAISIHYKTNLSIKTHRLIMYLLLEVQSRIVGRSGNKGATLFQQSVNLVGVLIYRRFRMYVS